MFAKKNSFTLGIIWLLLLVIGGFWYYKDAHSLVELREEEEKIKETLSNSQAEVKRLTQVENIAADMQAEWLNSPKKIISADEPSFTLSYLNWIISNRGLNIFYDFVLNSKNKSGDITKFTYTLTGEATYSDINRLVWHLTHEPILYQIQSLRLVANNKGSESAQYVRFVMRLLGFTVDTSSDLNEGEGIFARQSEAGLSGAPNIFRPLFRERVVAPKPKPRRVAKPTLPEKKPGEIDVEKATLKAVTPNAIFISEGSSGVKQLKLGDPVYLGKLVNINLERNEAQFLITKFGRSQTVTLRINERK